MLASTKITKLCVDVGMNHKDIQRQVLEGFINSSLSDTNIHTLELINTSLGDACLRTLSESKKKSNITNLILTYTDLSYPGLKAIKDTGTTLFFKNLTHFSFKKQCMLDENSVSTLAELLSLYGSNITNLKLDSCHLDRASTLFTVLPHTNIIALDLICNKLQPPDIEALARTLPSTKITKLNVSCNELGTPGITALARVLPQTKITDLDLYMNYIMDEGAETLAQFLPSTNITKLNVSCNKFGPQGIAALARSLPSTQITELDLHNNSITNEGAEALAEFLPYTKITKLNVSCNKFGSQGIAALAKALPQTKITELILYNGITEENYFNIAEGQSIEALAEALPNTQLTKLTLTVNSQSIDPSVMLKFYEGITRSNLTEFGYNILPLSGNREFINQLYEFIINNNITIDIPINGKKGTLCSELTKFNKLLQEQGMEDYSKSLGLEICQRMIANAKVNGDYEKFKVFVGHNIALFSQLYDELLSYINEELQPPYVANSSYSREEFVAMLNKMIADHHHSSSENVELIPALGQYEGYNEDNIM